MKLIPIFMLVVVVLFAGDTPKKEADKNKAADVID